MKEAKKRVGQPGAPYLHAAGHLGSAIECYRKIPGHGRRIDEIHRLMLEYQEKSISEYSHFGSDSIDLSEPAEQAKRKVGGLSLYDAFFALAGALNPTSVAYVREQAKERGKNAMLSLFPTTFVNSLGKTIARQPSLLSDSKAAEEEALRCRMYEEASFLWQLQAQGIIEPARYQITLEHDVRIRDFFVLVSDNPLVHPSRAAIFARGLHAGMVGDFATAAHFLIPQLEHCIRQILYQRGAIVSGFNEGIQHEYPLTVTLRDSRFVPTLEQVFGEDTVFDLRGLLIEPFGANLRNEMAHGLLTSSQFYAPAVCYTWWLTLRLCCIPIMLRLGMANDGSGSGEADSADEEGLG